jgi:uncharacterized membrane protein YraQ (UPF0718 family)
MRQNDAAAGLGARLAAVPVDRVWLASVLVVIAVAAVSPLQGLATTEFLLESWIVVAPFVVLSSLLSAGVAATGLDRRLSAVLKRNVVTATLLAAVFGALSPFCSVSVIPIAAALLAAGVPLAPVMAFWVGSPLIDPEMFVLTAGVIDLPFALARTVTAVMSGLFAGFATLAFQRLSFVAKPLRDNIPFERLGSVYGSCRSDDDAAVDWAFWRDPGRRAALWRQAWAIGLFMTKWLTLAFIVESLLIAWIPAEQVATLLGGDGWWVIPASAAVGMPTYLNGYAAIPTIDGLLKLGMEPGAALAFMIAGEVTSLPTAMSVFVIVRRGTFAWYLALGAIAAIAMGYLYRLWLSLM